MTPFILQSVKKSRPIHKRDSDLKRTYTGKLSNIVNDTRESHCEDVILHYVYRRMYKRKEAIELGKNSYFNTIKLGQSLFYKFKSREKNVLKYNRLQIMKSIAAN